MKVLLIPVTPFQQNCSLLIDETTQRAAVCDPGGDLDRITAAHGARRHAGEDLSDARPRRSLRGRGGAGAPARRADRGPQEDERFWIEQLPEQTRRFGFGHAEVFEPDRWLENGDTVTFGNETLEVYHCPGHTPGHVVFFSRANRLAIVGDVLFAGSIGRTDFRAATTRT
jgi:glyoxylase-like metal-dependent hydrolase (beta-lactamase superfamily II)